MNHALNFHATINGHRQQNSTTQEVFVTAEGETLEYLVEQLHTLLTKQSDERQTREQDDQPRQEDTEPVTAGTQPPSLEVKEKHSALKIVGINNNVLKDMYIKSEGVRDFIMKCCDYIVRHVTQDENIRDLIKKKHYLQLKAVFEHAHDKPYEPIVKTIKKLYRCPIAM
jgi:hypothetical protein